MITDSVDDIKRKLANTFVVYKHNQEDIIVYIAEVEDHAVDLLSAIHGEIQVSIDKFRLNTTFFFPKTGLYNINTICCSFKRRPERQWRKAPCIENSTLYPVTNKIRMFSTIKLPMNISNITSVFNPKYPLDLQTAVDNCKESVAISRDFGVSISGKENRDLFLLWYHTNPIGYLDNSTKVIDIRFPFIYQEVQDLINKKEFKWTLLPKN